MVLWSFVLSFVLAVLLPFVLIICQEGAVVHAATATNKNANANSKTNANANKKAASGAASPASTASSAAPSECEKKCHIGFSTSQRQQLCANSRQSSIGPALCSAHAKDALHLPFDKILELCQNANSVHPATCFESLNAKQRNSIGIKLCAHTPSSRGAIESDFLANCFESLSTAVKGSSKFEQTIVDYCLKHGSLDDSNFAPVDCVSSVVSDNLVPLASALTACDAAVSSVNTKACIHDFHHLTSTPVASIGLKPAEIVSLCASSVDGDLGDGEPSSAYTHIVTEESIQHMQSAAARCYFAVFNSSDGSGKRQQGQPQTTLPLSHSQRYELCLSAPGNGLSPAACALFAHAHNGKKGLQLKADDIVSLCAQAPPQQAAGPLNCFMESKGLGNVEHRAELCRGAANSVSDRLR
jgi:hypothetical protein